nr:hypothetical protein [Bacillus sp. SD075]
MISKHDCIQRDQLEMITLEQLVPSNHLVRKMEAATDFSFIYDLVKEKYSEAGSPSITFRRTFKRDFKRGSECRQTR